MEFIHNGLQLSEEEAYALLSLCLTSPQALDAASEKAVRKLAGYATALRQSHHHHSTAVCPALELKLNRTGTN
jgi:hypothetical protein